MPQSSIASNLLRHFSLCRRRAYTPCRRQGVLLVSLWLGFLSLPLLPAQTPGSSSVLGSEVAVRARAQRFLAGRRTAQENAPQPGSPLTFIPGRRAVVPSSPLLTPRASAPSASWTPVGPGVVNTSLYGAVTGRVSSIALDPNDPSGNTVWLGTTGGGVWRSTNAAAAAANVSFLPLTDTLPVFAGNAGSSAIPSLSIGAVAVQPAPNPVVLAGTGDPNSATDSYYGEGFLRSTDGGQTWTLIQQSLDGVNGNHFFGGLATAGFAWSTATPTLVVVAMTTSTEAYNVGAQSSYGQPGLYYSTDAGVTWHMAIIMDGSQTVQLATPLGTVPYSVAATSVVWDPQRASFFAVIARHGYYSSTDGQNWTRLAHQPGTGLTAAHCPPGLSGGGSPNCPILRGTLAVQPATGDLYALTVDASNNDQGVWQDLCGGNGGASCGNGAPVFATRLDNGALEAGQGAVGGSAQIPQGSYNLSLAAAPGANGGTVLFAGTIDLYRCSLTAGGSACTWRNTTNAGNGCNAPAGVAPAQHALAALGQSNGYPLLFLGNDGGLWRSTDGVAQTGSACAPTDAVHFANLNPAIGSGGSLAEVVGLAQDPSQSNLLLAGLGGLGTAASAGSGTSGAWQQLSAGEGGFPTIDPNAPANWYAAIGAGVNVKSCTFGAACTAASFSGSADIGAIQTAYDAALLDAPTLLDPQATGNLLTGTCRVWRGLAQNGTSWSAANALGGSLDGGSTPCTTSSSLIRAFGAGGPLATTGPLPNQGSRVLYAGMAGLTDGGGSRPGHVFVLQDASTATGRTAWADVSGSPVIHSNFSFNPSPLTSPRSSWTRTTPPGQPCTSPSWASVAARTSTNPWTSAPIGPTSAPTCPLSPQTVSLLTPTTPIPSTSRSIPAST